MPGHELPEGTDAIVTGAGVDDRDLGEAEAIDDAAAAMTTSTAPDKGTGRDDASAPPAQSFSDRIEGLKGQAGDRARSFVEDAKTQATDGIDNIVRLINDAATEVDAAVGSQYGDYIRRAGGSVSGIADSLKAKDVDALFADARGLIQKAPGVAIGVAAAIGFVAARLAQAGVSAATAPHDEGGKAA